jgi:hypothetical protein
MRLRAPEAIGATPTPKGAVIPHAEIPAYPFSFRLPQFLIIFVHVIRVKK